ncbi:hypothetical protein [Flavobacterium covae]|uniref:hypothetical protein n=1 Tax=Flavobacterium covae TaxID=2906076 RepID=UPI0035E3F90B
MENITIDLNRGKNLFSIIEDLSQIDTSKDTTFTFEYTCGNYVENNGYLLLSCFINQMRHDNPNRIIDILLDTDSDCKTVQYASRIDFFKNLNIDFTENFKRKPNDGRFIEIMNLPPMYGFPHELESVFKDKFNFNQQDTEDLVDLIGEVISNTKMHAETKLGSYLYCQKFKNYLEVIAVDCGIGVRKSFEKVYPNITNEEAIKKTIIFGEGDGNGRGQGLYFVSEFMRRNNSEFLLISGDKNIEIRNGNTYISSNENWKGTFLRLKINLKLSVPLKTLYAEKGM